MVTKEEALEKRLQELRSRRKAAQGRARLRSGIAKEKRLLSKAEPRTLSFAGVREGVKKTRKGFGVVKRAVSGFQREAKATPFARMGTFNGGKKMIKKRKVGLDFNVF